ncbi:MAG: polysaccharide biosynthesis protein [Saprospiraceae bacterium]|nr:polysaccharide biosynthesis protein [Saprospiraceae bacterium]
MSLVKQLAGETAIYGISSILSRVLHYVVFTVYLTNRVFATEPALYGIYIDMYAYAAMLLILFTYRMETAYFRFGSEEGKEKVAFSTSSISIFFSTIFLVILLLFARAPIADMLKYPGQTQFVTYFALIIGLDALAAIPFAQLRLKNRPYRFAFIKVFNVVLTLLLVFFFLELCPWLIDRGYTSLRSIYSHDRRLDLVFISNLIASAGVLFLLLPQLKGIQLKLSARLWRKMIIYAVPLIIVGLAGVFNQSFAVPLLKYLLPGTSIENLEEAGLYGAAAKLAILMNLFTQAFNYAAEPFFFKQAKKSAARQTYAEVAQAFTLAGSLVFLMILLYMDVVQLLIGINYRESIYSIVPVLLLAYILLGIYYNISIWYKITDKTSYGAFISIGGTLVTIITALLLIGPLGKVALAWSALACYSFMVLAGYLTGRIHYPIPYRLQQMMTYILLAVLVFLVSIGVRQQFDGLLLRLMINTLLLIVFCGVVYYLDKESIRRWLGI